ASVPPRGRHTAPSAGIGSMSLLECEALDRAALVGDQGPEPGDELIDGHFPGWQVERQRRGRRGEGRRVRPGRDARDANGDGEREGRDRSRMQLVAVAPRLDVNGVLRHGLALAGDGAAPLSADGRGRGNTTDAADARLIAEYAAREAPPAWQPPPP